MAFSPRNVISDISIPAPDFGLMAKSAQAVQNRYLDGFNKAQSYYKSLLNADITSADNNKYRAEYFKKVNSYLTNLAGVDFSIPSNVKAATDLFQPLVKDKDFVTDLTWTSMQGAEKAKMEDVRTNKDEKIRAQYDPMMQKAMDYSYQDMQNAKRGDGSIGKVGVQKFVPFQNIQNALNKAAKDLKLEVSTDRITGLYKITDKNGENAYPVFLQWARQQMGTSFDEQLLVTGKVKTREQVDVLMQGDPNLAKEDAYQQVAKNNSLGIYKNFDEYKNSLDEGINSIDKRIAEIKSKYNNKISKNDPVFQTITQLKTLKDQYQKELSGLDQSKSGDMETAFDQYMANPEYALLPSLKDNIAKEWAKGYADAKKSTKIEGDKVGLQLQNQRFKQALENQKELARWNRDRQKHKDKLDEIKFKAGIKGELAMNVPTGLEDAGVQDAADLYQQDVSEKLNNIKTSFLNQDVIEIATASHDLSSTFKMSYAEISRSLNNVIENWGVYGNNPQADPAFFRDYKVMLAIAKKANPGITKISDPGEFMNLLKEGVKGYKGGDLEKYKRAKTLVSEGLDDLDAYSDMYTEEQANINALFKEPNSGFVNKHYLKQNPNGTWSVNWENLNEEERKAIAQKVLPNYSDYVAKEGIKTTGQAWTGINENKWDFRLYDEVLNASDYVMDVPSGGDLDAEKNKKLKETLSGFGGQFSKIFGANGAEGRYYVHHGKEYFKFTVPVKTTEKGKKAVDTPSGGITFLIPKDKAMNIASSSPLFADMVNKVFAESEPMVNWIHKGLTSKKEADFPEGYSVMYGIQEGKVELDDISGGIHVTIVDLKGKKASEPVKIAGQPIRISDYMANPEFVGNVIQKAIQQVLGDYDKKRTSSLKEAKDSHNLAMSLNPNDYIDIDDIEGESEPNQA
jgi:hypothetical protein